jgi:uncharacterized protein YndB with AHSA1/START domain
MTKTMTPALGEEQLVQVRDEIDIDAPLAIVFDALLEELGPGSETHDRQPMPMKLEPWPGGRWYRDLGNNAGHFWGHVQVIKPPTLLEITGPLFMSYPAISHVQYRLTEQGSGTRLSFIHRAIGEITPEHREGMVKGWEYKLHQVRQLAQGRKSKSGAPK